ncbi:MAG TPA: ATP-binding protein [Thermoplasmatales archaeon]|nr:ATP-binding protein [Thermoplasmatales archaeon]
MFNNIPQMNGKIEMVIREYWERELPKVKEREIKLPMEKNFINDIVGPRRAGKTYLMFLTIKNLTKKMDREATIYINFENRKLFPLEESYFNDIIEFIYAENLFEKHETIYLFLDEIQRISGWEKYVRSIYDEFKDSIRIFVSGSSANLLSNDYSKLLTGRHLTTLVTPLNFKEFLLFKGIETKVHTEKEEAHLKKYLKEYLQTGGFPDVVLGKEKDAILSQLFTDIISRDVLSKAEIRKESVVEEFSYYLASNVSNLLSFNKMKRYFSSRGIKISVPTLTNYFWHLKNAFLFFDSLIFSYKVKDQMQYPRKIYCIDNGIANTVGFKISENLGQLYENTVATELLRRNAKFYYWRNKQNEEVDFVIKEGIKVKQLIQVCNDVDTMETKQREVKALVKAMEEFKLKKGLILTSDVEGEEVLGEKTITYMPLWKWLLD